MSAIFAAARRIKIEYLFIKFLGEYHRLIKEWELERNMYYTQYFRMSPQDFRYLANLIRADVMKVDTNWRKAISVEERLAVTLRYWQFQIASFSQFPHKCAVFLQVFSHRRLVPHNSVFISPWPFHCVENCSRSLHQLVGKYERYLCENAVVGFGVD